MKKLKGLKKGVLLVAALVAFLIGGIAVKAAYPGIPVVKNIKVSKVTQSSAQLTWSACDNVSGYIVYKDNGRGNYYQEAVVKNTNYSVSNLEPGSLTKYIIKSYVNDGGVIYDSPSSDVVKVLTMPVAVGQVYYDNLKSNSVDLSWARPTGADIFYVYNYNPRTDKYDLLTETRNTKVTVSNLRSCTNYYFVIQSSAVKEGVRCNGYCSEYYVVRTLPRAVSNLSQIETNESSTITMKWNVQEQADEYRIYYYEKERDKWICDGKVSGNKSRYTIYDLKEGINLKVKVRAVVYIKGEAVFDEGASAVNMVTAPGRVSEAYVDRNSITDTSAKIRWDSARGADGYFLKRIYSDGTSNSTDVGYTTSYTLNKLRGFTEYTYQIIPYNNNTSTGYKYCNYSGKATVTFRTKLGNVNGLKVEGMSSRSIAFDWNDVDKASGYRVEIYENDELVDKKKIKNSFFRHSSDEARTMRVTIKVWAYVDSDKYSELIYSPRYAQLTACNELNTVGEMWATEYGVDYITLKWKAVSGAKRYKVYGVDSNKKYNYIGSTENLSYKVTSLASGHLYSYVVKAETDDKGEKLESRYSRVYTFATKCYAPTLSADSKTTSSANYQIDLKWSKVKEADGYALYRYDNNKKTYVSYKNFGKSTLKFSDTNVQNGKVYYYYVCAFKKCNDKNILGVASTSVAGVIGNYGIEVSSANGKVDWKNVKDSGVKFAIIRLARGADRKSGEVGDGGTNLVKDCRADINIKEAKEQGIKVGVYVPTYAKNESQARKEANVAIDYLSGAKLDYPVYYDIQSKERSKKKYRSQNTDMAVDFCNTIASRGYNAGVYSEADFLSKYMLTGDLRDYSIYALRYLEKRQSYRFPSDIVKINNVLNRSFHEGNKYTAIDVSLWQYTEKGTVKGVSGEIPLVYNLK